MSLERLLRVTEETLHLLRSPRNAKRLLETRIADLERGGGSEREPIE